MRDMVLHSILLDLSNEYNTLDRYCFIDILTGYGVGPWTLRILRTNWFQLQMEAKAGGRYRTVLQSHSGVTQGEPLSSKIFNVVVDAVIRHWVIVVGVPQE